MASQYFRHVGAIREGTGETEEEGDQSGVVPGDEGSKEREGTESAGWEHVYWIVLCKTV